MKITWRVWVLIICIFLSILAIKPSFESGVVVKSLDRNSQIYEQGLRSGEIIKSINGQPIENLEDYRTVIDRVVIGSNITRLNIVTKTQEHVLFINETPNMVVSEVPRTKLKTGLDIQGGARALVKPTEEITDAQLQDLIAISNNRFNVFGVSDVKIRAVSDFSGNKYMLVEVAGATPGDLQDLIAKQGKFEAKIGNVTAFTSNDQDITSVCRNDATCAGVTSCFQVQGGYSCTFAFTIYLSEQAAKRHASITAQIPLSVESGGRYLRDNLTLILDDIPVEDLLISKDLKGRETTQISIQGSGSGVTQEDAFNDAKQSMHQLQTILITGSIPYKLEIVKLDTISAALGDQFTHSILLAGFASVVAVSILIFARYRKVKLSLALLVTSFSEIIIILGVASLIGWNLDLASIAGILATLGTGVDQQIVILDESRRKGNSSLKERMKLALFIVFSVYATALASLLPLYWAGAGLFKGFAITSIIGITAGVFITRPAFADMIKSMDNN